MNRALQRQRTAGTNHHITATATRNHIPFQQAALAGIEGNRALHGLEHTGGIEINIAPITTTAAIEIEAGVGAHLASDIQLAIRSARLADADP